MIKRYYLSAFNEILSDPEGDWVEYTDYAALESQLHESDKQATIHKDRIVALSAELDSVEAELQAAQAELNETYIDEDGETWFRPAAEAYFAVCKARNKWQEQSEEWRVGRDFFLTRLEEEKTKVDQLEAENAALRADNVGKTEALNKWKMLAHFMQTPIDWRTGESLGDLCVECIQFGEKALLDTYGAALLKELVALRVVRSAAEELFYMVTNFGDFRNGNSYNGIDEGEVMAGKVIAKLDDALAAVKGE